jgi:hypothetical protein
VEAKIARIEKIPEEGSITSQETIHREDGEIRPVESTSNVADTMAE